MHTVAHPPKTPPHKKKTTTTATTKHGTSSGRHRIVIPTQFMLWKKCCQAALSLTLSCDNPSSVIHKSPLLGLGRISRQSSFSRSAYLARIVGFGTAAVQPAAGRLSAKEDEQPAP